MNEIKFKGLDRTDGKVKDVVQVDFMNELVLFKGEDGWVDFNNAELMLYTGLKDKNDVEIYEGYIIKITGKYFDGTIFEGSNTFGVIYYAGTFVIRDSLNECLNNTFKNASWGISRFYSYDIEVIGNIYENSELIN